MNRRIWRHALAMLCLVMVFTLLTGMVAPASASVNKKDIVRVDFIHYAKQTQSAARKQDTGYKLMGYKWQSTPVAYSVNTASIPAYLGTSAVVDAIGVSSEVWDTATTKELFNNTVGTTTAKYGVFDGKNTVEFGLYQGSSNVIAVTSVWFNKRTKAIVEFDMLFSTAFTWGNAELASGVMDLKNIATHELGHAVGLSDIYSGTYSYVTMYGYASYGEIVKRTLEQEDITGLTLMYGQ